MEGSLVAYKVFTNGSVLNASEINDNLMNQSVMVFSNSAARSAALTSPVAGMVTFLEDTSSYESYDGAAWIGFGGGSAILQVVSANYSTEVTTSSLTYVATGLSATITPSSASSKIAIFASTIGRSTNNVAESAWTIFRGTVAGTNLATGNLGAGVIYSGAAAQIQGVISTHIVDSPNTTSAQTYTLGFRVTVSGGEAKSQHQSGLANMILMEVAG
jgi:hypothetical protein